MRVLLLYPRLQFRPQDTLKPDGSLALPYLAGELLRRGHEVRIFDASVGRDGRDDLKEVFYSPKLQPNGLIRVGVDDFRLLEEASWAEAIGITSIFTMQTTPVLEMIRLLRANLPEIPIFAGGVNARSLESRFMEAGCSHVFASEADFAFANRLEGLPEGPIPVDLDGLPYPAWHLLPLSRYWTIARPHGGDFDSSQGPIRYASLMTSRGCPFSCSYCHISKETQFDPSGAIGTYRVKSVGRVLDEAWTLKDLGVEWLFIEDDSLLAKKKRVLSILQGLSAARFKIADVNGVNLAHFLTRTRAGTLALDLELIDALAGAGFEKITLPFESANQRILDKWASRKWRVADLDAPALIKAFEDRGVRTFGNYMIGYPDETFSEIMSTVSMGRTHVAAGLTAASFFVTVPFPGSRMFDLAISSGQLAPDFDPDRMNWNESLFQNAPVSPGVLSTIRSLAWKTVNREAFVAQKQSIAAGVQ